MRLRTDLATALSLLTRVPVGWLLPAEPVMDPARAVWAFPIAGAAVGAIGAAGYALAHRLGVPPALAAIIALVALLLATGGLHEDGLADTADGLGGGRTRDRKLEIMRDSRIGSYGAAALILAVALRGVAVALLATPGRVAAALVLACVLGRAATVVVLRTSMPARADGLGASVASSPGWACWGAAGLAVLAAMLLLPLPRAMLALALTLGAGLALSGLARRQIGGYTGDVLGAAVILGECLVLTLCATP